MIMKKVRERAKEEEDEDEDTILEEDKEWALSNILFYFKLFIYMKISDHNFRLTESLPDKNIVSSCIYMNISHNNFIYDLP